MAAVKEDVLRAAEVATAIDAIACEAGALALNAALEAARGGEEGKAFADAAAQVRQLARRAAGAAREVRELAARSVREIDGCAALASAAGGSLAQVAGSVRAVEDIVGRLRSDSLGQGKRLRDVDQAIVRMDEVTRRNCVLVEEAAAAARTLQTHALALSRTVASFRLDEAEAPAAPEAQKESGVPRDLPRERRRHERSHLRLASSRK
jgi:methyl-accepting chemotaxis protein